MNPAFHPRARAVVRESSGSSIPLWLTVLTAIGLATIGRAATPPAAVPVDFVKDVRPILTDNCFSCHGPDDKTRKGKLRLDLKDEANKAGKSGRPAIIPGKPEESELVKRLVTGDADDLMPPAKSKRVLSAAQIETIRRWVAEGAPYTSHWAFEKPIHSAPPKTQDTAWPRNGIDRFILARLEKEGLKPGHEADKPTLIRRVTLDLTGLPPTPAEVDAFVKDKGADAYDRLVERLLRSPRFGEHMVRYWMDAARYADSHGFHIDSRRDIWAYREWAIQAFNRNMPFDQFTIEQLAGDLLPNPSQDQKIASGYVRNNMSTGEGGAIEAEYLAKYGFDRTETAGTTWLGLTLTCARCHSHKYDPVSQKEYYGLFAFFNNLDVPVMDGNRPDPDPVLRLPSAEATQRIEWLKSHLKTVQAAVAAPHPSMDRDESAWRARHHQDLSRGLVALERGTARSTPADTNASPAQLTIDSGGLVQASGPNPAGDIHELLLPLPSTGVISGLRLTIPGVADAGRGEAGTFKVTGVEVELVPAGTNATAKGLKIARAAASSFSSGNEPDKAFDDNKESGWAPDLKHGRDAALVLGFEEPAKVEAGAGLKVRLHFESGKAASALCRYRVSAMLDDSTARLIAPAQYQPWRMIGPFLIQSLEQGVANAFPPEQKVDFSASYPSLRDKIRWNTRREFDDGRTQEFVNEISGIHGAYYVYREVVLGAPRKADLSVRAVEGFKLWLNGREVAASTNRTMAISRRMTVDLAAGTNTLLFKVVSEATRGTFTLNLDIRDVDRLPPDVVLALLASSAPAGSAGDRLRNFHRSHTRAEIRESFARMEGWREEQAGIERQIPATLIARELEKRRETTVFMRGEYDKPGDKVEPGVPAVFPAIPAGSPTNRLGLARWLVRPDHPLTSRVIINRYWQQCFGIGLVKTAEDFGMQGERPSHPELLDWLATEFTGSGWDLKHMLRMMVTSATYRQDSRSTPALRERDPENRLLARGPRFRVDGEVIRDLALSVSGLLAEKAGGGPAHPYEPGGLWEAVSYNNVQRYVQDTDRNQYRRSLYTNWKRQSPPPNMLVFDAPTREYCVVRRPRTNTPLQALALLNDPQFVEASRALAVRMLTQGGSGTDQRLTHGFRLATGRMPTGRELEILRKTLSRELEAYQKTPEAAGKLLAVGAYKAPGSIKPVELAAWTTLASMLLNLDETITKG